MAGAVGLVVTVLGLWTSVPGKQLFVAAGVVSIVAGAFAVWRKEHLALIESQRELEDDPIEQRRMEDAEAQIKLLTDPEREWLLHVCITAYLDDDELGSEIARKTKLLEFRSKQSKMVVWNPTYSRALTKWGEREIRKQQEAKKKKD